MPQAAPVPPRPLAVPAFRALWAGGFLSEIGDWLLHIALPLFVLDLTGSPLVTATTFVLGLVPGALAGPLAGVVVDRLSRRGVLIGVSLAQGALVLPLLAVHTPGQLWLVYAVTAGESVLAAVFEPTRAAVVPELVAPDRLVAANALTGLNSDLGRLVGAPLGGLVLQLGGLSGVVLTDACSFAVVAALTLGVRCGAPAGGDGHGFGAELRQGLRAVLRTPALRGLTVVYALMSAAQGMFVLLFVLYVRQLLGAGDAATGLLRGVQAVGGLAGGVLVGMLSSRLHARKLTGWGLVGVAAVSALVWNGPELTTVLGVYVGLFVVAGLPGAAAVSGLLSAAQDAAPGGLRVRVLAALFAVGDGTQALALLVVGALAGVVALPALLDAQATLYLAAGVLALLTVPAGRAAAECSRAEASCGTG